MKLEEKNYFNKISGIFDTHFNVYLKPAGILRVQRRIKLFAKHCNLNPGLKIVEIGCGTGEYSKALLQYSLNLFATDSAFNMLKEAQKKTGIAKNIIFFVSDIEALPVSGNKFDIVVGNSILHHLKTEKALKEIYRVLKRGGRCAFSEPNMLNPQIFLQKKIKLIKRMAGDSLDETAFLRWKAKAMFEKSGFKNIIVKPFDFLHPHTPTPFVKIIDSIGMFLERTPLKEIAGSLFITAEK